MKTQRFGMEIELTGLTRERAAQVAVQFFGSGASLSCISGHRDEYQVTTADGRVWKFVQDGSIIPKKKERRQIVAANTEYSVEVVSPILSYEDIAQVQGIVRYLRQAGALSESAYRCGLHIHIDAARHTPTSLSNLVNLVASKEELIYKSLGIDPARIRSCKKVNESLLVMINRQKPRTLQALANLWYAEYPREDRCRHYHESRYYGLNFHSVFEKGTVEFRLFNGTLHAGKVRAYLVFCLAVSHQALAQKTARFSRSQMENEKYGLRT